VACTLYAGRKMHGFDDRSWLCTIEEGGFVTTMGAGMGVTAVTLRQCWVCGRNLERTSTLRAPPALMRATPVMSLGRRSLEFALVEFGGGGISDGAFAFENKCRLQMIDPVPPSMSPVAHSSLISSSSVSR